jgi:DNA polymerase III alpha subunit
MISNKRIVSILIEVADFRNKWKGHGGITSEEENYQRLIEELQEFRKRNMLDLLRWLKYFVDTAKQRNIIWGVGRGSSVASYVLYLIGVHKIDSIKYKLDWKEFLR